MSDLKMECVIKTIRYFKDNFGIILVSPTKILAGEAQVIRDGSVVLKGEMPRPIVDKAICINADYTPDPRWGDQYTLISSYPLLSLSEDKDSKYKFLSALYTEGQVESMYDAFDDPFDLLDKRDVDNLVQIKGCGVKTAIHWINKFHQNKDMIIIFTELQKYDLTNNMVTRLMERYNNPELVVEKVTENPYILCTEVKGIGWDRADQLAMKGGLKEDDPKRIGAYIVYYLGRRGEEGCSWITTDELLGAILDTLGEDIPDEKITEALRQNNYRLWVSEDKTCIGLKKYYNVENRIAKELIRLRDAQSFITIPEDWKQAISKIEMKQGWNYNGEQMEGIQRILNANVILIQGMAGTGKTSIVNAIISVLGQNYSYVQCALSGRAAARMAEVTGKEGFTIHRLLGYPKGEKEKGGFEYHDENQLPYNIYILDEISMVDGALFYNLLRAIPDGSKLICLGDHGQLESIGSCNIAHDMMMSPEIDTITLTQIHRQAQKSAIITQSVAIRRGHQIIGKDWAGEEIQGELRDLKLTCYSDINKTYYEIMASFTREMARKDFDIMETQVIFPRKSSAPASTFELNNAIQDLYNPRKPCKEERVIHSENRTYILREGDKVMNVNNNYQVNPVIYNGNIGIIQEFYYRDDEEYMRIDFVGIGIVSLPRKYWGSIELGYAITCHKFQGSQANVIIFGIDFTAYNLLTREMVYTGMTRAKERCHLIAQNSALRYATAQEGVSKKQTHLINCLNDIANPQLIF